MPYIFSMEFILFNTSIVWKYDVINVYIIFPIFIRNSLIKVDDDVNLSSKLKGTRFINLIYRYLENWFSNVYNLNLYTSYKMCKDLQEISTLKVFLYKCWLCVTSEYIFMFLQILIYLHQMWLTITSMILKFVSYLIIFYIGGILEKCVLYNYFFESSFQVDYKLRTLRNIYRYHYNVYPVQVMTLLLYCYKLIIFFQTTRFFFSDS